MFHNVRGLRQLDFAAARLVCCACHRYAVIDLCWPRLRLGVVLRATRPVPARSRRLARGDCCSRALPATPARASPALDPHWSDCYVSRLDLHWCSFLAGPEPALVLEGHWCVETINPEARPLGLIISKSPNERPQGLASEELDNLLDVDLKRNLVGSQQGFDGHSQGVQIDFDASWAFQDWGVDGDA